MRGANLGLIAKPPYDPLPHFVPIGLICIFSNFLVVHLALPMRMLAALVTHCRPNAKPLRFASGNTSSLSTGRRQPQRLVGMLRVPSTGDPRGITDVIAGRVSIMFSDISSCIAHVKSGALRANRVVTQSEIAYVSKARSLMLVARFFNQDRLPTCVDDPAALGTANSERSKQPKQLRYGCHKGNSMSNPWLKKNPFMSMWLSGANSVTNSARGRVAAEAKRQSTTAANKAADDMLACWTDAMTGSTASKRRRK